MEWSVILLSTHFHLPPAQLLKFHLGSNRALFLRRVSDMCYFPGVEIEGKCGPRSLDRIWSKEQRWQDHILLGRLFIWCRDKPCIMSPSVIGWKTAQLLNKVGSNEDLYWLAVFDSRWLPLREQSLHDFMIISVFSWHEPWYRVITPGLSTQMSARVLRQIPTTGSWIAVISFPGYLSGRNHGTQDNTLLTTSETVAQWPISHPTYVGRRN